MRGPQDDKLQPTPAPDTVVGPPKVEERLALFERERGLTPAPMVPPEPSPRRRGARASNAENRAVPELQDPEFANRYIETANALTAAASAPAPTLAADGTAQAADAASALIGPWWRSIGPTDIPDGQTYGSGPGSRVNVSGRVATIAIDPANANHVLVGSAGGGIWETRDNGATWSPRTDQQPTLTTGALAFDPNASATVYALTGEGNFYWRLGAGLLRSVDGGTTWGMLATTPFVGQGGYDLLVDPGTSSHLLAATTGGLYESSDSGVTWTQRRARRTWDLSMHPTDHSEVLAGCSDGAYRSTDGGQTWTQVTLPGAPASWDRLAVAHAPSDGRIAYVFAASGATAYLWRRNASGTWSSQTLPAGARTNQAWYDWYVAVAPDNSDQLYLGEIHLWRGDLSGSSWTWTNISSKNPGSSIHPDQHAIAFQAGNGNLVWAGNDGGAFRSNDRGTTWTACNTGIGITEIEYMAQNRGTVRWLLAGTQDNGTIGYGGSLQWTHLQDGDGGDCTTDSITPTTVFHTFFNMGMERSTQSGVVGTWQWRGPNVADTYRSLFYPPVEGNGTTVGQAGESLFVSTNDADSFTEVTLGLSSNALASAMTIPTDSRVLVGSTAGEVVRVDRSGSSWTATSLTRPAQGWISDLAIDPRNANRIWATLTSSNAGRVYRSDDGGTNWTDVTAGLPNLAINAVEIDPSNSNRVWVAADVGIWQTLDAGAHWASFGLGLPNALSVDLLFHPHARVLRAATRNRGAFEIDVDWPPAQFPICGTQWTGSLGGGQTQRWFTFNWPATWHVIWTVMPTSPRPGSPQVRCNVEVERASTEYVTYWITVVNLTPTPVTFEGRYAILSRY